MPGETTGMVRWVLRFEGLCVLVAALLSYDQFGVGWGTFAFFFLAPDLSLLGYFAGPRIGAIVYNAAHSYIGAIICLAVGFSVFNPLVTCAGIIWSAHIGLDRALGFGLKYSNGFGFTHLGLVCRFVKSVPVFATK
jgi:hypothetical protein